MIFVRRGEKRATASRPTSASWFPLPAPRRRAGARVAALLLGGTGGQASLLHVIEVPFERQLDAEDPRRRWPSPMRSSSGPRPS